MVMRCLRKGNKKYCKKLVADINFFIYNLLKTITLVSIRSNREIIILVRYNHNVLQLASFFWL